MISLTASGQHTPSQMPLVPDRLPKKKPRSPQPGSAAGLKKVTKRALQGIKAPGLFTVVTVVFLCILPLYICSSVSIHSPHPIGVFLLPDFRNISAKDGKSSHCTRSHCITLKDIAPTVQLKTHLFPSHMWMILLHLSTYNNLLRLAFPALLRMASVCHLSLTFLCPSSYPAAFPNQISYCSPKSPQSCFPLKLTARERRC